MVSTRFIVKPLVNITLVYNKVNLLEQSTTNTTTYNSQSDYKSNFSIWKGKTIFGNLKLGVKSQNLKSKNPKNLQIGLWLTIKLKGPNTTQPWLYTTMPLSLLGKLSKIKTTKHMEFSMCLLTPPPYQHMENSFVIFLLSKKMIFEKF